MSFFRTEIITWYLANARKLPWRAHTNPYFIWISEVILQQTRVEQGLPYYYKFIEKYPTIADFANAPLSDILLLWQGLGYYSRARNMHKCAQIVLENYDGKFPASYNQLLLLPGIGKYTAAAIASFCFNEKKAVVDGNVNRLVARYLGIDFPVNEKLGMQLIEDFVTKEIDKSEPANFNQAMMEMGAIVCKPSNPLCNQCVLAQNCFALKENKINLLPIKTKKVKVRIRYLHYFVADENQFKIYQRDNTDVWASLYEFPILETDKDIEIADAVLLEKFVHQLTHQKIYAKLWKVMHIDKYISENLITFDVDFKSMEKFPMHQLMIKMIKKWQELTK